MSISSAPRLKSTSSAPALDRKSTRLNSSHMSISYADFCLKKKILQRRTAANIIPARTIGRFLIRSLSERHLDAMREHYHARVEAAERATRSVHLLTFSGYSGTLHYFPTRPSSD